MNVCDICRNHFTPGPQGSHRECICPVCGRDCMSYRPNPNQFVFRVEHSDHNPQFDCVPIYEITRDVVVQRHENLPSYKPLLKNFNSSGSIPRITPNGIVAISL